MSRGHRISSIVSIGSLLVLFVSAFAFIPPLREEAVRTLNERGDFQILLYEEVPADTAIRVMAGVPYVWLERYKVKQPLRIENPTWSRPVKGNTIGTSDFRMGVYYRTYLLGDTIIFLGK